LKPSESEKLYTELLFDYIESVIRGFKEQGYRCKVRTPEWSLILGHQERESEVAPMMGLPKLLEMLKMKEYLAE
jgi:hypothetical protein